MATTKVQPYNFEEFKAACEQHNNEVKSASKGVVFKVDAFDETEVRVAGVCHELTYEDLAFYYVWADDGTHCGNVEGGTVPTPSAEENLPTLGTLVQDVFNKHRSLFAFKHLRGDLFIKVQICGYVDEFLIVGYQDETGLVKDFTSRATLDRNTFYSASYSLVHLSELTFIS